MKPDRLDQQIEESHRQLVAAAPPFASILGSGIRLSADAPEPHSYHDLNLDQVVAEIVRGRDEYDIRSFFHLPLQDGSTVAYRHAVFRDLASQSLRHAVESFSTGMKTVRQYLKLVEGQYYGPAKQRWFLDAATVYCNGVSEFDAALSDADPQSDGFRALRSYLSDYVRSEPFQAVASDAETVREGLGGVEYTLLIQGLRVTVNEYRDEPDYSEEVERTFARFRQADAESHLVRVPDSGSMDHVEAQIAERLARLFPKEFGALKRFCSERNPFVDSTLSHFDREVQFYLSYLEFSERLSKAGIKFSLPEIASGKTLRAEAACDVALAAKISLEGGAPLVANDFELVAPERILVVSGPNQGGKTTFARMFGQLHCLAALGVPVPARHAQLFLPDQVFAHFERQEDITTLRGKLDDELVRIRAILDQASAESVIVVNEIFASTTLADAIVLGTEVVQRVVALGCPAVFVTFVDELSRLNEATVSMVATVDPADPTRRTFRVVRRPADGRAYAVALAEKYGLTYEQLKGTIVP